MKAIIDPRITEIMYISSWKSVGVEPNIGYEPVYSYYSDSARVAEVQQDENVFPIAEPLFWTDCPDNCVQDDWYYDTVQNICKPIENAPAPLLSQPQSEGTQTL